MSARRPVVLCVVFLATAVLISSCRGLPIGPSLSAINLGPLSLQPTINDNTLCCCRVTGTVRNANKVPVHATFKFPAFDGTRQRPISSILFFIPDFQPGTDRPIDAHGFIFPCNVIKEIRTELEIKGLTFPPL